MQTLSTLHCAPAPTAGSLAQMRLPTRKKKKRGNCLAPHLDPAHWKGQPAVRLLHISQRLFERLPSLFHSLPISLTLSLFQTDKQTKTVEQTRAKPRNLWSFCLCRHLITKGALFQSHSYLIWSKFFFKTTNRLQYKAKTGS